MAEIDIARALLGEESALLVTCTHQSWMRARRLTRAWTKVRDREMEATTRYLDDYASAANKSPTSFADNPKASHEVFPGLWAHQSSALTKGAIADNSEISGVVQVLQEVFPVTAIADLVALVRRREVGDARENIFDFQDGQGEQVTLVFPFLKPDTPTETACMQALTEADLLTLAPSGGGYLFDTRKWAVDQDTHTASLTLVFRKVTWNEWGHDSYVEDFYEYDNVGNTNTEEIITRTWVHIRNEDVKAAVTDLRTGARTAAGLSLLSINVSNGGGGACTISVREQKIDTGTDQLKGREILRPFGWPECIGIRDIIVILLSRYPTLAAIESAITTLALITTPPTGFTFVRHDTSKDGSGKYEAEFRYEKVTWSNHTGEGKPVFKQTSENNTEGNGKAQGRQACALTQDTVVAAFNAITAVDEVGIVEGEPTTLVKYVLSSKGISIGADGEFSLSAGQTSVYEGTTASDALIIQISQANPSVNSSKSLQRVWFRRTLGAKNTLTGAGGQAGLPVTVASTAYSSLGWSVTDHHDGAYTVSQSLSAGPSAGWINSNDRTDEYVLQQDLVLKRISGGAENYEWMVRRVTAKIFTGDDGAEDAWAWARAVEEDDHPAGYTLAATFDDTTGDAVLVPIPVVTYIGGDSWRGTRELYYDAGPPLPPVAP